MAAAPSTVEYGENGGPQGPPLSQTSPKLSAASTPPVGGDAPRPSDAAPAPPRMSDRARAYYALLGAASLTAGVAGIAQLRPSTHGWLAFGVLTAIAGLAQLFIVEKGSNQSYRT